jgi:hypothetical protein
MTIGGRGLCGYQSAGKREAGGYGAGEPGTDDDKVELILVKVKNLRF